MPGRREPGVLRLSPDYSAPSPVWSDHGCVGLGDLGISPALATRLDAWNELFQEHFRYDSGWDGPAARAEFATQAYRLLRDLRAELDPTEVVLEDWTGAVPRQRTT